jgi:hypothetical protein
MLEKLERYKVWRIVKKTRDANFGRQMDLPTETNWWRARWVAKGYRQVAGIDYNKTHAAVAHKDTHGVFLLFVNTLQPTQHCSCVPQW